VTISIALASYNGEAYIREQLDSLAAQTLLPDELVITDDGSTDRTAEIVAEFADSAPFPVHFHRNPERLGYARNFERAIGLCRGEIIFLSDQDDVWFAEKLSTVRAAFDATPAPMVVVNDQILTDARLGHDGHTKLSNLRRLGLSSAGLIEGCCTAFRSSWATLVLPIPADESELIRQHLQSHDRWINELAILLGVRHVIDAPLQYFRRTGSNTTSWIVSEPRAVGMRDQIMGSLPKAPVQAWQERIDILDGFERWIRTNRMRIEAAGIMSSDEALASVADERRGMTRRSALATRPFLPRAAGVIGMWASGDYRYFNGWKSAVRDLTRST
jgi:glycosyltransferase involved in cell wall biosynthesis